MNASLGQKLLVAGKGSSLRAQLIRGSMGVGGLKILSLALAFGVSVLLARTLGPEGFGQYAFIWSVVTILALPLDQGMQQLITREVAAYHHESNWALFHGLWRRANQWVLLAALLVALVLGALAVTCASWAAGDRWTLLLVGLLIPPFLGLKTLRVAALRGMGYVVRAQLPELLVRPGFHLLVLAGLLVFGLLTPFTAIVSQAVAAALAFLFGALLLGRSMPADSGPVCPQYRNLEWAQAWIPFTLIVGASALNKQIGILLLGWLGTDEQIGALRLAERGATLVALSLAIVNLVIAPHITRAYREGRQERLQNLSRKSARLALALALPIALPLIFFGAPIIGSVFGTEYVRATTAPLAIMAGAQLINVAFGSVGMFLSMSGFERETLLGQGIALGITGLVALLLIPRLGAEGAAWAGAIGLITWNLILGVKFKQRLSLWPSVF